MEPKMYILDQSKLESMFTLILNGINAQINARIVQTTEGASTTTVASSKLVADEVQALKDMISGLTHIKIETYVGPLADMPKNASVIYLQKDSDDDPTWEMYVTVADTHVSIGPCTVDLSNCWKKDEVEAMKTALGLDNKLEASDLEGYAKTTDLDAYLKQTDVQVMTDDQITTAFNNVFNPASEP